MLHWQGLLTWTPLSHTLSMRQRACIHTCITPADTAPRNPPQHRTRCLSEQPHLSLRLAPLEGKVGVVCSCSQVVGSTLADESRVLVSRFLCAIPTVSPMWLSLPCAIFHINSIADRSTMESTDHGTIILVIASCRPYIPDTRIDLPGKWPLSDHYKLIVYIFVPLVDHRQGGQYHYGIYTVGRSQE
jgi:hypothetical protein